MQDTPGIYINSTTPGFQIARVEPNGPDVDVIFDKPFEDDNFRPQIVCAEQDAGDFRSRSTKLTIDGTLYVVQAKPFLDGMGLATIFLREE